MNIREGSGEGQGQGGGGGMQTLPLVQELGFQTLLPGHSSGFQSLPLPQCLLLLSFLKFCAQLCYY